MAPTSSPRAINAGSVESAGHGGHRARQARLRNLRDAGARAGGRRHRRGARAHGVAVQRGRDAEQAPRASGSRPCPSSTTGLALSERFDPDAVPAVLLLDGGEERGRVEGLHRARLRGAGRGRGRDARPRRPARDAARAARAARAIPRSRRAWPPGAPARDGRIRVARARDRRARGPLRGAVRARPDRRPARRPAHARARRGDARAHEPRPAGRGRRGAAVRRSRRRSRRSPSTRSWRAARGRSCRSCWPPWRPRAARSSRCTALVATTHPAGPLVVVVRAATPRRWA